MAVNIYNQKFTNLHYFNILNIYENLSVENKFCFMLKNILLSIIDVCIFARI